MTISISTNGQINIDRAATKLHVTQDAEGTRVYSNSIAGGYKVHAMPHARYSLTSSFGLNPGVAGLDQFEADILRLAEFF